MVRFLVRAGTLFLGIVALCLMLASVPARADDLPPSVPPPPMPSSVDARGVDLLSGQLILGEVNLSIGASSGHPLSFSRQLIRRGWGLSDLPTLSGDTTAPVVSFGGHSIPFKTVSGAYVPAFQDGSTLSSDRTQFVGADGTVITFGAAYALYYSANQSNLGRPTQVAFPDGVVWTYHYAETSQTVSTPPPVLDWPEVCNTTNPPPELCGPPWQAWKDLYDAWAATQGTFYYMRLASITSSAGYQIKLTYASDDGQALGNWLMPTGAKAINNAVEYCDPVAPCSLTNSWPTISYDNATSMTDPDGRTTSYSYDAVGDLTGIRAPGESSDTVTYAYAPNGDVASVTTSDGTWTYTYGVGSVTVTPPTTSPATTATTYNQAGGQITSVVQGALTTQYAYCDTGITGCPEGLLQTVTMSEGNKVTYAYDARGNRTSTTYIAKSGSGLANLVTSAAYPSTCTNQKICNKPTSTTDAGGNVTNYTYNASTGLVTQVQAPAVGGQRPTTNYVYATKYARYLTAASTWTTAPATVLTETNTCRTAAACNGTANEARTILSYPANTVANNLQPSSVAQQSGDGTLSSTTTIAYDNVGRVSTVDGPLTGTNDQAMVFYDAAGVMTGKIGADPDGSGGNPRPAVRYTFNAKGQLTTTESGTATALTLAALNAMSVSAKSTRTYDGNRRLRTEAQVATSGTTQYGLVQYTYDALGRTTCTALRMNAPLTTTTLPTSACTAMTAGTYGADRITQNTYNALGQVTGVLSGVGTTLSQTTAAYTYTNNGKVATVTDAGGNKTTYTYDGFDRPVKTQYPSLTTAGSSTTDYEQLTYGTSGNEKGRVTGLRTRRGEGFGFFYDNLGRTTQVTVPERSGLDGSFTQDVDYVYNVAGDMLSATFHTSGLGITTAYDAFGRPTSSTDSMFATPKTIGYGYDVAGNRTTLTHPDATSFTYVYDAAGRSTGVKLGATQLAGFSFNNLGQLTGETRYNTAPGMSYGYDAAGRLTSLGITGAGSNSVGWGYGYNPAGEVISTTRDNDLYAYTGNANVNRTYAPNRLNQYTTVGTDPVTYDAGGNLANDNHTAFTYDPQNMLVGASGGNTATLHYDPLGRLFEITDGTTTTQLLYDGNDLIGEYDGSGNLLDRYVHGVSAGDDPLFAYDGSTTADTALRQLYADRLGSVVLTTGSDGTLTGRGTYDEWGLPDAANAGVGAGGVGRFGYTGQAWLPELGMSYYKARMYSPVLGRFMQTDPIGYGDGMNMYDYVGNNPVNGTDPTGMWASSGGVNTFECPDGSTVTYTGQTNTPACLVPPSQCGTGSLICGGGEPGQFYAPTNPNYGGVGGSSYSVYIPGNITTGGGTFDDETITVSARYTPGYSINFGISAHYGVDFISPLEEFSKDVLMTAEAASLKAQSKKGSGKNEWIVQPLASRDAVWYEIKSTFGGTEENPREGVWVLKVTPNTTITYRTSTQGGGRTLEFRGPYLKSGNNSGYLKFRFSY